ncbi:lipase family protein [Marinibactrum halimedae]|uniref:Lipase n=1 Tax=Marinibactrum halimedae TaxID=1444977 RepID=A0AA37WPI9_9GAMM|nr:lipase family protein [Marinibactrum halimedae]MCD9458395.1 lipase family protein [Marinibactrum halimedae]GLS26092.1 lipase [Marinibactrum halimedae]
MALLDAHTAAVLARDIYGVNDDNEIPFRIFLGRAIFAQGERQKVLKAAVGGHIIRSAIDGFGVCVMGEGIYKDDLFLIFRGTTTANNKADFVTDARIGITYSKTGSPVHIGFNHTFNSMQKNIETFINAGKIKGTIHCVGHSLGGAVASLAADWISANYVNTVQLYTFGAPRVGLGFFTKKTTSRIYAENMHRIYHRTDPVPMIPLYPYAHAPSPGKGYFISSSEPLATAEAHSMQKYVDNVESKSWEELGNVPEEPYTIESEIERWLKSKSPVDANSHAFWRWIDSALIYVLKKVAMSVLISIQGAVSGSHTILDKIAYMLAKGIDLSKNISIWVQRLMRKLMQALGMEPKEDKKDLTRSFIHRILVMITQKAYSYAKKALKSI